MRCECCDRILSDVEATSKFKESGAYTNMCTTCQGYLPKEVTIITRKEEPEEQEVDYFDFESIKNDQEDTEE